MVEIAASGASPTAGRTPRRIARRRDQRLESRGSQRRQAAGRRRGAGAENRSRRKGIGLRRDPPSCSPCAGWALPLRSSAIRRWQAQPDRCRGTEALSRRTGAADVVVRHRRPVAGRGAGIDRSACWPSRGPSLLRSLTSVGRDRTPTARQRLHLAGVVRLARLSRRSRWASDRDRRRPGGVHGRRLRGVRRVAVRRRVERGGPGEHLDLSMLEAMTAM